MKIALMMTASLFAASAQLQANPLTVHCENMGGLTEQVTIQQTESQTTISIKSLKAKELLETILGDDSVTGLITQVEFTIPRSCNITADNAFSFYCPSQRATLTFSGDQVIDIRDQDIGFNTVFNMKIGHAFREESVLAGLNIYSTPQPLALQLSATFAVNASHSGELSNPSNGIIKNKCSVNVN